jgi:hypothetical protein
MYKNRTDQLASQRKHYRENKEKYLAKNAKRLAALKAWYKNLKANLKCSVCGESHPACLHFHHTNPAVKDGSVSSMIGAGAPKKKILVEIAKCIVLCANCHAKLHAD